jgi:hypothetical protein
MEERVKKEEGCCHACFNKVRGGEEGKGRGQEEGGGRRRSSERK